MSLIKEFISSKKSSGEILKFIVENRMKLYFLLRHITWDDILNGNLILTENMVNSEIVPLIQTELEKSIRVSNLNILLEGGIIDAGIIGKYGLFSFEAHIYIEISAFEFYPGRHLITLDYREEISSVMGFNNERLMKIIRDIIYGFIKNSFIQKGLNSQPGIIVDNKRIIIDLDCIQGFAGFYKIEFISALLRSAEIGFLSCDDGKLIFKISFRFDDKLQDIKEIASTDYDDII